jgi:hypothetical protein
MADDKDLNAPGHDTPSSAGGAEAAANSSLEASASGADGRHDAAFLPVLVERFTSGDGNEGTAHEAADDDASAWQWHLPGYAPIAAMIALAAVVGALAGAATTAGLLRDDSAPIAVASNQALQGSVEKFGAELAALKSKLGADQRYAHAQFGKLAQRLDRAEKAQAEPSAKIAKIADSLDRLERRIGQTSPEVTGSIASKSAAKPQAAEGWRLVDFYAGRAVVESRGGRLFEVGPGSNLPELGRVETIKRENGRVVVTTRGGIIAAAMPRRRPPYYLPYPD